VAVFLCVAVAVRVCVVLRMLFSPAPAALVAPVVTESSSSNVGLVAGIAAGIVVLVLLVLLAVILARRRRNGVRPSPVKPVKPVKRTQISSGPTVRP
jgi:hypothetical protein